MRLAFKIALRFLTYEKTQTILIAIGIAVGISVQIFIGLLIDGLQTSLINKTIGSSPHITITSLEDDKTIKDWTKLQKRIEGSDSSVLYTSPSADGSAFIEYKSENEPILLRGILYENGDKIYNFKTSLYAGVMPRREKEVLIGKNLADELDIKVKDRINIKTPAGDIAELKVSGIFDLKVASINKSWIITDIATSQRLFGYENKITSIEVQVKQVFNADKVGGNIERRLKDSNIKVENWKKQNEQLLSGLSGQSMSSLIIQIFVLVAVLLGISSVLAISVTQKSKQLGILKAMGIKDMDASLIFLFQGSMLGIIGAIFGIGFGLFLTYTFTRFALNPDGTPIVDIFVDKRFIIQSAIIAVITSTIAAAIPARKSSRLNPIEVIKNG